MSSPCAAFVPGGFPLARAGVRGAGSLERQACPLLAGHARGQGRRRCVLRMNAEEKDGNSGKEPIFTEPMPGETGYDEKQASSDKFVQMYDGDLDDIDRSNFTFGQYNKLGENDLLLGKNVMLNGVGKEGPINVFYREAVPVGSYDEESVVLLLSGLPASSYSYRDVLPAVAEAGYRAVAPDWIGFGFSDKAAPGFSFSYETEDYVKSIHTFLQAIGVKRVQCLVAQGWLGTNGLLYALRNPDIVESVYILNSPLPPSNPRLPFAMSKWSLPAVVGDAFAQDSLSIERAIEGGSTYVLATSDAEVYRRPSMLSGDTGFSLAAACRKLSMPSAFSELSSGFARWDKPVGIGWGLDDKYITEEVPDRFVSEICKSAKLEKLEGMGHFAQEDFADRVASYLLKFIRSNTD